MKRKVLVLYHRTPYEEILENRKIVFKENTRPNGIIPLLKSFLAGEEVEGMWIAGSSLLPLADTPNPELIRLDDAASTCLLKRVPVSAEELNEFYHVSSKEGFWPVLHSFPEKFDFERVNWDNFLKINERFAAAALEECDGEEAIIWVHDYNLWMVPHFIRKKNPRAKICFFLHTPFPAADIFNILPWRQQIISSLLCCDMITFSIPRYVENFVAVARSVYAIDIIKKERAGASFSVAGTALSEPYVTREIMYNGSSIKLCVAPVGTDCEYIARTLRKTHIRRNIKDIRESAGERRLIFTVSRMDYIKGTDRLLECYQRLLDRRTDLAGKVVLKVVAVEPAQGIIVHRELQVKIRKLVKDINAKFMTENWQPVIYLETALSFEEMIGWYAAADIMWVPSLRDGTNLVCKEYVAVKKGGAGVLLLSEFIGAAVELTDAITFNPYSAQSMDDAIDNALLMPVAEQVSRNSLLYSKILASAPRFWGSQLSLIEHEVSILKI